MAAGSNSQAKTETLGQFGLYPLHQALGFRIGLTLYPCWSDSKPNLDISQRKDAHVGDKNF